MKKMNTEQFFPRYFETLSKTTDSVSVADLQAVAQMIGKAHHAGKKVIIVGNGGSAAIASHVAVDLTKAASIRAVNFNEADLLTCLANDYGYAKWVEKALEFWADPGDLAITISSSGNSANIVKGARQAKLLGLGLITLSGFDPNNPLRQLGDLNLWADSDQYNIVETTHQTWLLSIVDYLIESGNMEL
tara:strand:+ start:151 stop:717 length:567 start_codon:yes stop_codon:yes gene_type:complete